ncbi:inward rectifier potassium channel 16, partial [Aplochiton taeniatus]
TVTTETSSQSKKCRYVSKDGSCNVLFRHVPEEWLLYVQDIFTTLVEIRWRVMLLTFALSYILSWLLFGVLYWVIALANGDLKDPNNDPCMFEVRSFTGAFLFSLETQTTIGYGFRGLSESCPLAIVVVTVQSVTSCFIDTFIIGIAVAKMASARRRATTVGFSNCAVIGLQDSYLCLSWRIGDFRGHHLVEGTARAQLVRAALHATGKVTVTYSDLQIKQNYIILATPTTIFHRIVPGSPLYGMSLQDLRNENFELVVSFTYVDDATGILHQTRTSYTSDEILWGHLFQEMLTSRGRFYRVDFSIFHQTAKVLAPECSAEEYERKKKIQNSPQSSLRSLHPSPRASHRCSPKPKGPSRHLQCPTITVELVNGNPSDAEVAISTANLNH